MQLTRNRIITAAMDLIERDDVEGVSMHRLATHLGCDLVALYSYVPSTSALFDAVADVLISGIELPPAGQGGWQEQIRAQARALRARVRAQPRCTLVVMGRPPASATALRPVEHALGTLADAGFAGQDAVRIIRVIIAYVLGSVLGEIGAPLRSDAGDAQARRPRLRSRDFPLLTGLSAELAASKPEADFEFGLDLVLHSLSATCQHTLCTQPYGSGSWPN